MQNKSAGQRGVTAGRTPHAEKRALWEVRQRYRIDPSSPPTPPHPPARITQGKRPTLPPKRPRRHMLRRVVLFTVFGLLVASSVFGYKILSASNQISVSERSILGQLKDLLFSSGQSLKGERDGRINVLLLAVGGEGHKGEELADTIILASIKPGNPTETAVALLSIPRDLYVQVPGQNYFSKINAVHAYGEAQKRDFGPTILKQKVEEITGVPIHYYGRVDFKAFKHIIDAVGGIDITIDNGFFDYWHKISFPAGTEHMNGERALAYVRARYIEGPEGGDFKRAARQQQVLLALRDKLFSVQTAFDFAAINTTLNSLSENIRTDLELWEMRRFYELVRTVKHDDVYSAVLTSGPHGVLVGSTEILGNTPASVLKTRTGDYSEIQAIVHDMFTPRDSLALSIAASSPILSPSPSLSPSVSPSPPLKKATIEIRNGTTITGLAQRTKEKLTEKGYTVTTIGNAHNRATEQTTVFALNTAQADIAKEIADMLSASIDSPLPQDEAKSTADILIILGSDAS